MKEKKLKYILHVLRIIEVIYLLTFFFVMYLRQLPHTSVQVFAYAWIGLSLMVLPLLILKNIMIALFNNGLLSTNQKIWLIVRCAIYILLATFSYPLILSL
jgi:hypothetical protein